jgi:ATP phosphoribosyltransferase regulatory subunit
VERRGFEYQTGLSFTLFARGVRGELGRGGRYRAGNGASAGVDGAAAEPVGEPATGLTLFMDTVLRAVPGPQPGPRVFVPLGTKGSAAEALRVAGWTTVAGLESVADVVAEARRLGCGYVLDAGTMRAVDEPAASSPA